MKLTLCNNNKITKLVLPQKIEGIFLLIDEEEKKFKETLNTLVIQVQNKLSFDNSNVSNQN